MKMKNHSIHINFKVCAKTMKVCIFCSANNAIDAVFFRKTEELGRYLAERGHILVYGGCNQGLMECVSKACALAGGHTIGVVPSLVESGISASEYMDERIDVSTLSERKQKMMDISDVFIALPGGIGTLDEVFSVAASATIGYHTKKVILYNIGGFWNQTLLMLDDLRLRGMLRGELSRYIVSADSLEELDALIAG